MEAEKNLRQGLKQLRPILLEGSVKGYVEPLGMQGSTMKKQSMAVAAIADVDGWDAFELCFDAFLFFRCGDSVPFPERIGLAHMSGIVRRYLSAGTLTEPDRVLIESTDRAENINQLRALKDAKYSVYVSMEPFNIGVRQSENLESQLRESLARVNAGLFAI